jgi:carboxylesterase type B
MQSEAAGLSGGPESWKSLSTSLNCTGTSTLACVRKAPASAIKSIMEKANLNFDPVKDDITCSKNISLALTSGKAAKVPFIIGSNAQDGTVFAVVFGGSGPGSPGFGAIGKSLTEVTFQCPAAQIATAASTSGFPPVYRYFFNATFAQYAPFAEAGAYHSAEIEPIFGTFDPKRVELKRLGESLQGYWTGFAKNPSEPLADWPKVEGTTQMIKVFGTTEDKVVDAAAVDQSCAAMAGDIAIGGL